MKGRVNYHIEEDRENYKILIDVDGIKGNNITKYSLVNKKIDLVDPRDVEMELKFLKYGLQFARYPSTVKKWDTVLDSNNKEVYEQELVKLLKAELENVEEVVVFDHTVRSEISDSRPPVYHVHGDYTDKSALTRARDVLGSKITNEWLPGGVHCVLLTQAQCPPQTGTQYPWCILIGRGRLQESGTVQLIGGSYWTGWILTWCGYLGSMIARG